MSEVVINARVQTLYATAAVLTESNPMLMEGELGTESDTGQQKIGDGVTSWNSLDYLPGGVTSVNTKTGVVVLDAADVGAATTAQGSLADSAVQPEDLAPVATSGAYDDLTGLPTLGTAAATDIEDYAPAAHVGSGGAAHSDAVAAGAAGFMSGADKTKLDGIEDEANNYMLPIASASTLGGVKVGEGLLIDAEGVLTAVNSDTGQWTWRNTAQSGDPGSQRIGTNALPPSTAAFVHISDISALGADVTAWFERLSAGDLLTLQDKDNAANVIRYSISSDPIDNGTWWQIPVTLISGGGTTPGNNSAILVNATLGNGVSTAESRITPLPVTADAASITDTAPGKVYSLAIDSTAAFTLMVAIPAADAAWDAKVIITTTQVPASFAFAGAATKREVLESRLEDNPFVAGNTTVLQLSKLMAGNYAAQFSPSIDMT